MIAPPGPGRNSGTSLPADAHALFAEARRRRRRRRRLVAAAACLLVAAGAAAGIAVSGPGTSQPRSGHRHRHPAAAETAIALQITLATGEFRTGRYMREEKWDTRGWKRDEASN